MNSTRSGAVLLALGLALAGTAACGGEEPAGPGGGTATASASPTPATNGTEKLRAAEAVAAAKQAYLAAPSVHLKGTLVDGGTRIAMDLRQAAKGRVRGTITMDGAKISLIVLGDTVYFAADRKFWLDTLGKAEGTEAYKLFKGKWMKVSSTDPEYKDFAEFADRKAFAEEVFTADGLRPEGKTEDVAGVSAVRFFDDFDNSFYIATQGEPYPLKIAGEVEGEEIQLDFLDYGKPVDFKPPPEDKVFDVPSS